MIPKLGFYIYLVAFLPKGAVVSFFRRRFALFFFSHSFCGWKLGLDLCYLSKKCMRHTVLVTSF